MPSSANFRLKTLILSICIVVICAALVWRNSFVKRGAYTKNAWQSARMDLAAQGLSVDDRLVFLLGSSVVRCGFDPITNCDIDGQRWVFVNIGKPHLDHRSYLVCGIYDSIREQFPQAEVWQEARTFFQANYSDWVHDADFGGKIKSSIFDQIQRELSFDATTFAPPRAHAKFDSLEASSLPVEVIDSTSAPTWGIENRYYANEWRANQDLALLRNGLVDALFEMPTCPSTREKNRIPEVDELPSEALRNIRTLPMPFLRESGEGFWFKDYADPGHLNANGRIKMADVLCRWAHEAQSSGR